MYLFCFCLPVDPTLENVNILPSTQGECVSLSQQFQSEISALKTPVFPRLHFKRNSPDSCSFNRVESEDDMFASPTCDEKVNPSALNALFDRPEQSDLSWSMVTPSANQTSNTSWSNLNTEERMIFLPSDGSSLLVKPRALFSPDRNDTADSPALNMSSDAEGLTALKGQKNDKTPKFRTRKNSLLSAVPVESPLATCIVAEDSFYTSPDLKTRQIHPEALSGSPILSGSNEFSKPPSINQEEEEEDLFDNEEECLVGMLPLSQTSEVQDPKVAESTPHAGYRKMTHSDEIKYPVTPHSKELNNGESFLQDISVTALEEVCQAQELKDRGPLSTPEKHSDAKRKRVLFSSNLNAQNHSKGTFKTSELNNEEKSESLGQDNENGHCIPDDSFMEHLAAMNTSIFSDVLHPVSKVQSIKTSLSKMKKFCYSADKSLDQNGLKKLDMDESKSLMKEILSSVMVLETATPVPRKTKSMKSSGNLVVFSQLQEEMNKDVQEEAMGMAFSSNESSVPKLASRESKPLPTNGDTMKSLLSTCEGFQTGTGKQIDLSKEALSKGLNLLKDCMETADVISPANRNVPTKTSSISSSFPITSEANSAQANLSDDLAAEEIKQLLQLVSDGEDFNPWHDTEEITSPKSSKQQNLISHVNSKKCGSSSTEEDKIEESNLDSLAGGFSTAGGKRILVSDENLARAEKLLLEPEKGLTNSDESFMPNKNFMKNSYIEENNQIHDIHQIQNANEVSGSSNRKRHLGKAPNASDFTVPKKRTCLVSADTFPSNSENSKTSKPRSKKQDDVSHGSVTEPEIADKPLVNISQDAMNVVNSLIFSSSKRKDPPSSSKSLMGFSTASGGTINVSEKALDKVKNLFDSIEMESCDKMSVDVSTCFNKDLKMNSSGENRKVLTCVPVQEIVENQARIQPDHTVEALTTIDSFSTTSGKEVNVTEKAMKQVKDRFDDVSEPDSKSESKDHTSNLHGQQSGNSKTPCLPNLDSRMINDSFEAGSGKSACARQVRRSLGSFSKQGLQSSSKAESPVRNMDSGTAHGSFSAGRKGASVSYEAVSKVKKSMLDENPNNLPGQTSKSCALKVRRSLGSTSKQGIQFFSKIQTPSLGDTDSGIGNGSFATGNRKSDSVSKEAFSNAKNASEDTSNKVILDLPPVSLNRNTKSTATEKLTVDMTGFSTAGGKAVQISKEALDKARNLFDDLPSESLSSNIEPSSAKKPFVDMAGFSTAGGRAVQISKEALNKARNLFDDLPSETSNRDVRSSSATKPSIDMAGFSTAGGKPVQISKEALNKARTLFDDLPSESSRRGVEPSPAKKPSVDMAGFSTAGGKPVQISKEALHKARNLFDDLPSESSSHGVESISAKKPSVDMTGFSTAGGKAVQISKEALNRAKNLFDDLPCGTSSSDVESLTFKKPPVDMVGFSTAGGSAVQVSKEALKKARKLLEVLPSESSCSNSNFNTHKKPTVNMAGFSTAGGRTVEVSEDALKRARNLFDNPPSDNTNSNAEEDSGVFLSCNDSHINSIRSNDHFSPCANKENNFFLSSISSKQQEDCEVQKSSLTQEITESTAAILADDGFDMTCSLNLSGISRQTISTSPSMVTDRSGGLKPIFSFASEDKCIRNEPTSPILSKSFNGVSRKRPRRGRLSLSTITGTKTSPTSGNRCSSKSQEHQRTRLSLPSTVSSNVSASSNPDTCGENSIAKVLSRSNIENITQEANNTNDVKSSSEQRLSRKLFASESDSSPAKLSTPNTKTSFNGSPQSDCNVSSSLTPDHTAIPVSRPSHQNPLVRKALTKSLTTQPSGFKTPYKNSSKDQPKRSPSSPLQNPPEAKRMKPSTNLYVSHVEFSSPQTKISNPRYLRPEVAEMRRRVAEEQKQVVDNYSEHKGELLRPCAGSWFSQKHSEKSCGKLMKLSVMGPPASYSPKELLRNGVRSSSMYITAANAADFRFSAWEYYSEDVCRENVAGIPVGDGAFLVLDTEGFIGVEEFQRAFLASPGVDPSIVPSGWIKNHYRWLVWKLSALECHYPCQLGGRCFSPHVLMLQLKYRYDREIDRCERPALRRIFEHDDSAAKRMVLCVASILNRDEASTGLELELTDGWYSVITSIDQDMQSRVKKGTIKIGTKLIMHNAELMNCSEGCFPLQVRDDVRLKLCSNSTRRARWYAKLGFQANPGPINMPLSSILSSGGLVSCVTAYVARVYPLVFMEKTAERTVVRSQRAEAKEVAKCERRREQLADKVYSQVQAELQQEQTRQKCSAKKFGLKHVANLTSGEELSDILENASDPLSIQSVLTDEQMRIVSNYQRTKQDELRSELEARVRLRLSDNANHERQVTPILKVRLFDEVNGNQFDAILSVWRASEDMSLMFKEGQKMAVFGAVANGTRFGEMQLSANRSTRYDCDNSAESNSNILRCVCPLTSLSSQGFVPRFGEIDIVGIVIRISPAPQTSENPSHFQTVYLSDSQQNIVGILFWGGMKEFGLDDLIVSHSFIAASNLQCRGSTTAKAVPCVYASELSFFTTNPRQQYLQTAQQELRHSLTVDLKTFCQMCEDKLDDLLSLKMSPAAFPKTSDSISPVPKLGEENCVKLAVPNGNSSNMNSIACVKAQRKLSMEEQLKTPSPSSTRSPAIEKRLASLERYGDAVPISPIFISQPRRSLRQDFKAPRRTNSPSNECKRD